MRPAAFLHRSRTGRLARPNPLQFRDDGFLGIWGGNERTPATRLWIPGPAQRKPENAGLHLRASQVQPSRSAREGAASLLPGRLARPGSTEPSGRRSSFTGPAGIERNPEFSIRTVVLPDSPLAGLHGAISGGACRARKKNSKPA